MALLVSHSALAQDEKPPFDVQNARGDAPLNFSIDATPSGAANFVRSIRLINVSSARADTSNVSLADFVLETTGGDFVTVRGDVPAIMVDPGGIVPLVLTTTVARPGAYRGEMVIVQGKHVRAVHVTVTVSAITSATALPIEIFGNKPISSEIGSKIRFAAIVSNKGDTPLSLAMRVVDVSRVDNADAAKSEVIIYNGASEISTPQALAPGVANAIQVDFRAIPSAGIYRIDTMITDAAGKHAPQLMTTTLYQRESWIFAALAVACGALLAFTTRWFVADGRTRLETRRAFAFLRAEVANLRKGLARTELIGAARNLELDIEDRERTARWGGKLNELEEVLLRAQLRLTLLREVVHAMADVEPLPPEKQASARKILDNALAVVREDPGEASALEAVRQAVLNIAARALRREQLRLALAELQSEVRRLSESAVDSSLVAPLFDAIANIESSLKQDDLETADRKRKALAIQAIEVSLLGLESIIARGTPKGVAKWTEISIEISKSIKSAKEAATLEDKAQSLRSAQRKLADAMIHGLISFAEQRIKFGDADADRLNHLVVNLHKLWGEEQERALSSYPKYLRELETIGFKQDDKKGQMASRAEAVSPTWLPVFLGPVELREDPPARLDSVKKLDRAIGSWAALANAAVFVVALASGVRGLWVGNLSWGGADAYLVAFLWGAGVQAAGDAAASVLALRGQLAMQATS
ncbi:MAG: hypothetical protein Q8O67_31955 [Deltaproteobacteria bacterium]|nr:hypothetical protein [Deltaproteobacteria bacterium]